MVKIFFVNLILKFDYSDNFLSTINYLSLNLLYGFVNIYQNFQVAIEQAEKSWQHRRDLKKCSSPSKHKQEIFTMNLKRISNKIFC